MQEELLILEHVEEEVSLSPDQLLRKSYLSSELFKLNDEEEIYWRQRSHDRQLHEGDNNTEYFHMMANGRKRKNTIVTMEDGDKLIKGDADLLSHATEYYKNLFGPEEGNAFPIDPGLWEENKRVNGEENSL